MGDVNAVVVLVALAMSVLVGLLSRIGWLIGFAIHNERPCRTEGAIDVFDLRERLVDDYATTAQLRCHPRLADRGARRTASSRPSFFGLIQSFS